MMFWSTSVLLLTALINIQVVSTETKLTRTKPNLFDPVLSANAYVGRIKESESVVQLDPPLQAADGDPSNSPNGQVCGYELSLHKHDDVSDEISKNIPFIIETINGRPVLKVKPQFKPLDCETTSTYRLFIRAFDCAPTNQRRYSERSLLTIYVEDINEHVPVFTHNQYLFKLHQDQTCESSSCRVEATDDDCSNRDHRVCGYEIITPDVPFAIDANGSISITRKLTNSRYDFDVIARDCYPSADKSKQVSLPAHVTFKIIPTCRPSLNDKASTHLTIQSDHVHLFESVKVNACEDTCQVEDIVGTVTLDTHGLDSGCNPQQCSTVEREYVLLPKDKDYNHAPQSQIRTFDGYAQSLIIKKEEFSGHFNDEFIIKTWMKHSGDADNQDKHHIFCKSDEKLKNRHHTALFIQNNQLKLLLRKGPVATNDKNVYESEWIWKLAEITDGKWHSYKIFVNYPTKVDLYIDDKLVITNNNNFQVVKDHALATIEGTDDTIFAVGACWHGRASRMVQHFRGQLSGLLIEQKEELQRSSECVRDCHQYLDLDDVSKDLGTEFVSNSNRSMWILRTDAADSYEDLLHHLVYRNTFQPLGPSGQQTVSIHTQLKCAGENTRFDLSPFKRTISIDQPKVPSKIEVKTDTNFVVPERAMNQGIYLFRNLSIYTNAIKKSKADISDCTLKADPELTKNEQLIVTEIGNLQKIITPSGAVISGVDSIDAYQYLLRQIAYISKSPVKYTDRTFTLSCKSANGHVATNEIRVRVNIERQVGPPAPVAAIHSNKLVVENDHIVHEVSDVERSTRKAADWPIAVVICVSVGLAGVLVLYLVVRIRSNKRRNYPINHTADDIHSQMEWEDDIGLNITVNPLDETKKSASPAAMRHIAQTMNACSNISSDDEEGEEYGQGGQNQNEYSSEEDEECEHDRTHSRKLDHQLEWDDAAIEYGPKKV